MKDTVSKILRKSNTLSGSIASFKNNIRSFIYRATMKLKSKMTSLQEFAKKIEREKNNKNNTPEKLTVSNLLESYNSISIDTKGDNPIPKLKQLKLKKAEFDI